jgi:hypothetical protein
VLLLRTDALLEARAVVERFVAAAAIHHNHHLTVIRNQLAAVHADMIGHSARLVARGDVRL